VSVFAQVGVNNGSGFSTRIYDGLNGGTGYDFYASGVSTNTRQAFSARDFGANTADNIGAKLDVSNAGAGNAYSIYAINGNIYTSQSVQRHLAGAGTHVTKLGGNLSTDKLQFQSNAGTPLFDIDGTGAGGFRVNGKTIYFGTGSRIVTGPNSSTALVVNFGLYACKLVTLLNASNNDISNLKQLAFSGAYDSDASTIAMPNKGAHPTSAVAGTYKQYGYPSPVVATNIVPNFYIHDYITPANSYSISLFKSTALTVADGTLANAVIRIAELEAKLQANGLLA